jgi:hypothetical protein
MRSSDRAPPGWRVIGAAITIGWTVAGVKDDWAIVYQPPSTQSALALAMVTAWPDRSPLEAGPSRPAGR